MHCAGWLKIHEEKQGMPTSLNSHDDQGDAVVASQHGAVLVPNSLHNFV
jgi:hypothetical protein